MPDTKKGMYNTIRTSACREGCGEMLLFRLSDGDGHLCLVVFRVPQTARAYFAKMSVRKSPDPDCWVCTQRDELPSLNGNLLSGGDGKCGKIPLWGRLVAAYALPEGYEGKKKISIDRFDLI